MPFFNYGLLPQTWEDPSHVNAELDVAGDNDPVDVVELGPDALDCGSVTPVRVVGALAMIDEGEIDWKMIAINAAHPAASRVQSLDDVEREFPGQMDAVREWFRDYKIPDGKPANAFGFGEKVLDEAFAASVLAETHAMWKSLDGKREI